ncbi:DUF2730 family protein [Erwinia tracheiphila]|uniref:DUF2730 family protein n=1 Tax=Erwinia tracheiphila TaxID=65700 RepID=UPI001FD75CB7|nr:DUF2730 family protein [Erwinia tracheiphila]
MPNQKELHALQLDMANLPGDLKAALPELRQLRHMSDLLLQNELKKRGEYAGDFKRRPATGGLAHAG